MVQQYELFKMKEGDNIESLFFRFQVLVSGLQVLNKIYMIVDHIKNILRSLPVRFRLKVSAIQEAKDLHSLSLESLIINLQSHKLELNGDDPEKQVEFVALKSVGESQKSSQNIKEATHGEVSDEEYDDDELAFIIKRFKYLARKKNIFSSKKHNFKGSSSGSKDQNGFYSCKRPGHFIVECLGLQKDKRKDQSFHKNKFISNFKKNLMAIWEELDNEEEDKKSQSCYDDLNLLKLKI